MEWYWILVAAICCLFLILLLFIAIRKYILWYFGITERNERLAEILKELKNKNSHD